MTRIISSLKTKPLTIGIVLLSFLSLSTFALASSISKNDTSFNLSATPQPIDSPTTVFTPIPTILEPFSQKSEINISPIRIADTKVTEFPASLGDNSASQQPTVIKSPTPTLFPPTPSPTPVTETVAVTVTQPNGTQHFTVAWQKGMTVCDVIKQAKVDGRISSLTIDESYIATFRSPYIYEINGYKDNWVFEVNGESALGCALVTIEQDDHVVWKYL